MQLKSDKNNLARGALLLETLEGLLDEKDLKLVKTKLLSINQEISAKHAYELFDLIFSLRNQMNNKSKLKATLYAVISDLISELVTNSFANLLDKLPSAQNNDAVRDELTESFKNINFQFEKLKNYGITPNTKINKDFFDILAAKINDLPQWKVLCVKHSIYKQMQKSFINHVKTLKSFEEIDPSRIQKQTLKSDTNLDIKEDSENLNPNMQPGSKFS